MQEGLRNTIAYNSDNTPTNCDSVFLLRRTLENGGVMEIKVDFSPLNIT